ncbi:hypothetical protein XENTR_v10005036 [Xenopus tropicalis]|nr:hypothetical protein XENTR_v10005036 [Xenopus tropicalis]
MPFLLEAPDCDAGTSNNSGHIVPNQEQESEPKEDNSTSSSLPSEVSRFYRYYSLFFASGFSFILSGAHMKFMQCLFCA